MRSSSNSDLNPGPIPGRRILLALCGGIAAYKSAELARRFTKAGCEVQVVMTDSALRFIGAQTFQALTGKPVRSSLWDEAAEAAMGHIELARWPDAIVIAPATANTLAKIAHGFADDLLTTLVLATDKPIFVAPAMNRLMWANAATQANMSTLRSRGFKLIGPGSGAQACGEVGEGRVAEPEEVAAVVLAALASGSVAKAVDGPLSGRRAVVTAGPTREPIDPVRFITNRSSGKQGYAVAEALRALGAEVTLISGPVNLETPAGVHRIDCETAQDMLDATIAACAKADILVGTAAVADYRCVEVAGQKIKKKTETLELELTTNADILAELRALQPQLFIVGFAAETEKLAEHAKGKLARKKLNLIAANWVGNGRAFDRDDNALTVYWADGELAIGPADKREIARQLASLIAERYAAAAKTATSSTKARKAK
ncbi:bifunctional phosphopantothenoylcysteine decarboxylase/phosphopantothenate--cysteine ligase CoaBC [uncultured Nevskia sp.]|uniref:bifunctional phosphopantothenoylcysteine decarboxylase/phosphopantothenate--cysteine ligase CoaBC n=1 Tax=uncultured Nevskia sp. TaxID=228950 RepID=UPI0025E2D57E|nr:bifunctional phosphopantothenoylcysteine decarboxylase/phosphopantothenate--cysteine ligase CoaBC [uncultured Nevskia sp.]